MESRTPFIRVSRGRTAAPTLSGPAHAPRPTSSIPTTTSWPRPQSSFSMARVGARFFDCFGDRLDRLNPPLTRSAETCRCRIGIVGNQPELRRRRRCCPQHFAAAIIGRPVSVDRRCAETTNVALLLPEHCWTFTVPTNGERYRGARTGRDPVHFKVVTQPPTRDTRRQQFAVVTDLTLDTTYESPHRCAASNIGE